jgi:hypothetical protein
MRIAILASIVLLSVTGPTLAQGKFVGPKSPRCVSASTGRFICVRWVGRTCVQSVPEKKTRCW